MDNGKMANLSKESVTIPMEKFTMEIGLMENLTAAESKLGQMAENMTVYGIKESLSVRVPKYIPMGELSKVIGKMGHSLKVRIEFLNNKF